MLVLPSNTDNPSTFDYCCWRIIRFIATVTFLVAITVLDILIQGERAIVDRLPNNLNGGNSSVPVSIDATFAVANIVENASSIDHSSEAPSLPLLRTWSPTAHPSEVILARTASPAGCPVPARFHVSGEPDLKNIWAESDAYLLSGGYNLFPGKAAYHTLLIGQCCRDKIFRRGTVSSAELGFKPIAERTLADVLYRSSYCEGRREKLTGIVRRKVEAAGFTFLAWGKCEGEGHPVKSNFVRRGFWTECEPECVGSKIMLSFEHFEQGHEYLSEKLFVPLEHGTVPIYFGNGQKILDEILKVNRKAFIDHNDYGSDEALADKIVDLLRHPEELQRMQDEPVFLDMEMARKRVMFFQPVGNYGDDAAPELYHALRENERFKKFINGKNVKIRATGPASTVPILQHVLNIQSFEHVYDSRTCVDIEAYGCC